jgi:hypothetical protein
LATALRNWVVSLDVPIPFHWRQKRRENTMFTEAINKVTANHKATRRHHLLSFFFALVFALTIYPTRAHAQIIGDLEANISFQFYVGDTKFPAGEYRIRMLDDSDLTVMQISSVDGSASAVFPVEQAEKNSEPTKSELIFHKYGNRRFLAKLFEQDNPDGSQVVESSYEKKISQATSQAQIHVPARHGRQQGK